MPLPRSHGNRSRLARPAVLSAARAGPRPHVGPRQAAVRATRRRVGDGRGGRAGRRAVGGRPGAAAGGGRGLGRARVRVGRRPAVPGRVVRWRGCCRAGGWAPSRSCGAWCWCWCGVFARDRGRAVAGERTRRAASVASRLALGAAGVLALVLVPLARWSVKSALVAARPVGRPGRRLRGRAGRRAHRPSAPGGARHRLHAASPCSATTPDALGRLPRHHPHRRRHVDGGARGGRRVPRPARGPTRPRRSTCSRGRSRATGRSSSSPTCSRRRACG